MIRLPAPPVRYDQRTESTRNRAIEQADQASLKTNTDNYMAGGRIILTAPDGGKWALKVNNSGILSTEAVP